MNKYSDIDLLNNYPEEENTLGKCEGYIDMECPNCGRVRVEHWSCGKDICEKCHWCVQDESYCREHMM